MKLARAAVRKFRNFIDSTTVEIQPDITCLVGKNESGKTAFAQAFNLLNPARNNVQLSVQDQYPAWLEKRDRLAGQKLEEFRPIEAIFRLEEPEESVVEQRFGKRVLRSDEVTISRNYAGELSMTFDADEKAAVDEAIGSVAMPESIKGRFSNMETFAELVESVDRLAGGEDASSEAGQAAAAIKMAIEKVLGESSFQAALEQTLQLSVPQFFYFANYSSLPYSVKIKELLAAQDKDLSDDLLTARCLLRMAGADQDYLLNPDYERRKRELENVANALTQGCA
ncbi:MAG: AAA family ATPase [Terriglobia bacterium]